MTKETDYLSRCIVFRKDTGILEQSQVIMSAECLDGRKKKEDCDLSDITTINAKPYHTGVREQWFWDSCASEKLDSVEELLGNLEEKA